MRSIKGYKVSIRLSNDESGGDDCIETLCAERTFGGYRILNIPFKSRQISIGDIVRIDESTGEVLTVVRRSVYRNGMICYGSESDPVIEERFHHVVQAFETHEILVEGMMPGIASLAVPAEISQEQFWIIVRAIPEITSAEIQEEE